MQAGGRDADRVLAQRPQERLLRSRDAGEQVGIPAPRIRGRGEATEEARSESTPQRHDACGAHLVDRLAVLHLRRVARGIVVRVIGGDEEQHAGFPVGLRRRLHPGQPRPEAEQVEGIEGFAEPRQPRRATGRIGAPQCPSGAEPVHTVGQHAIVHPQRPELGCACRTEARCVRRREDRLKYRSDASRSPTATSQASCVSKCSRIAPSTTTSRCACPALADIASSSYRTGATPAALRQRHDTLPRERYEAGVQLLQVRTGGAVMDLTVDCTHASSPSPTGPRSYDPATSAAGRPHDRMTSPPPPPLTEPRLHVGRRPLPHRRMAPWREA
jgi:hypothetical protein